MKTRTVRVEACFPASADAVWDRLQRLDTLRYIAAPYASFAPVGDEAAAWAEGRVAEFRLKLFGFVPIGLHAIRVKRIDKDALVIHTNESNRFVPLWNHEIVLQKTDDGACQYRDEVELYAGWKTPIIAAWCRMFYRHRQKRWMKLLR